LAAFLHITYFDLVLFVKNGRNKTIPKLELAR